MAQPACLLASYMLATCMHAPCQLELHVNSFSCSFSFRFTQRQDGDYCLFCEPSPPRGSAWRGRRAAGCWLTAAVAALVALASYLATARARDKEPTVAENRTSCVSGNVCQAAWVQRTSHHLGVPQPSTGRHSLVRSPGYMLNK